MRYYWKRHDIITDFKGYRKDIEECFPASRERSVAITSLDTCILWLKEADSMIEVEDIEV